MTRAGLALRQKWADEARWDQSERQYPGCHARHWAAGMRRAEVLKRWGNLLIREMGATDGEAVLAAFLTKHERVRVVERPGWVFVVTSRRTL